MFYEITFLFLIAFVSFIALGLLAIFTHLIERLVIWIKRKIRGEKL